MFSEQIKRCVKICGRLCETSLFAMFFLYAGYAHSEELAQVQVDTSQPVIYCDIASVIGMERLNVALKEGSLVTYAWEIIREA